MPSFARAEGVIIDLLALGYCVNELCLYLLFYFHSVTEGFFAADEAEVFLIDD